MPRYNIPRMPHHGEPLTADWGREVIDCLQSLVPRNSESFRISKNQYGTNMTVANPVNAVITPEDPRPFNVRWCLTDAEKNTGEWQIYLPRGCATIRQSGANEGVANSYIPVNAVGKDIEGDDTFQWYKIPTPEKDELAEIVTLDYYTAKMWPVYVLMKPWARMKIDCDPEAFEQVAWSQEVAKIGIVEMEGANGPSMVVQQGDIRKIEKTWDMSKPFSIRYTLNSTDPKITEPERMDIIKGNLMLGRLNVYVEECMVEDGGKNIIGQKNAWVKINHPKDKYELTIEHDLTGNDAISDNDKTVIKIYEFKDGKNVVTQDYRENLNIDLNFYTNGPNSDFNEDSNA